MPMLHDISIALAVVRPVDKEMPRSEPLLRVDVRKLTDVGKAISAMDPVPMRESDSVGPPLARPCFSPFEAGRLALATEQHPLQESSGAVLIVTQVIHKWMHAPVNRSMNACMP
jgi:hypothetical protein